MIVLPTVKNELLVDNKTSAFVFDKKKYIFFLKREKNYFVVDKSIFDSL